METNNRKNAGRKKLPKTKKKVVFWVSEVQEIITAAGGVNKCRTMANAAIQDAAKGKLLN